MWKVFLQRAPSAMNDLGKGLPFAPPWVLTVALVIGVTVVLWLLYAALLAVLRRLLQGQRPYLQSVLDRTRNPTRLGLLLIALAIALPTAPIGSDAEGEMGRVLILVTISL